jgi:hypothetical protein
MCIKFTLKGIIVAQLFMPSVVFAQRGTRDPVGIARQAIQPEVVLLEGKLLAIDVGPCEHTTGHAAIGTHLKVQSADEKQLNIHLGPATYASSIVRKLEIGKNVKIEAFRTPKLAKDHYVAKSLQYNGETIELRNEALRPKWAGSGRSATTTPRPCPRYEGRGYRYGTYPPGGRGMGYGFGWRSRR